MIDSTRNTAQDMIKEHFRLSVHIHLSLYSGTLKYTESRVTSFELNPCKRFTVHT